MYLNHTRKSVVSWHDPHGVLLADPAFCPDCNGPLTAVRGDDRIWHWRHQAGVRSHDCQMAGESMWHLDMKQRHLDLSDGWEVEFPVDMDDGSGGSFRFDAYSGTGKYPIREFVHSLSPSYHVKSAALHRAKLSPFLVWIFDAEEFVSDRRKLCRGGGFKSLVKPAAWDCVAQLTANGQLCVVDHERGFVPWAKGSNIWYPLPSTSPLRRVLARP